MKNNLIPSLSRWKRDSYFLIISVFFILITLPARSFASETLEQKHLSMQVENKTIKEVLNYIESNSEFVFLYSKELAQQLNKKVSISADQKKLTELLNETLADTGLTYHISDRQITITKGASKAASQQEKTIKITGRVLDENEEAIPGANVIVKGNATQGTVTDIDGKFTIMAPKNGILVATFIGYSPLEYSLKGEMELIFKLKPDAEQLDEVVVVGFGSQKKASVVGSIASVKPDALKVPSSSLSNSFAGRIAGVVAVQRSGEPGADGASFWIRGVSTFAGPTSPLIYIDGVEVSTSDLNALSPEVIESFSILKDASATALYGARGANGVMLITTRSGKENERAKINIRVQNSFTAPTQTIELADGVDYMNAYNNAILNRTPNATPRYSEEKIDGTRRGLDPLVFPNVNWQDFLFKDFTTTQSANLNVSGGTKKITYFLSGSVNNDNGMLKKDPLNKFDNNINQFRISFQGNIKAQLTPTTKVGLRINSQIINYSGSAASTGAIYGAVFEAPPVMFAPVYPGKNNEDHILFGNQDGGPVPIQGTNLYRNPYAMMVSGYANRDESAVITSFDLEQDLKFVTPGLSFKALVSFKNWTTTTVTRSFTPYYYAITSYNENTTGGYDYEYRSMTKGSNALTTSTSNGGDRLLNVQASLDYSRRFGVHEVGAMMVYLQRDYNINNPENNFYKTLPTRNQGMAGRVTYAYDDRYLLEANFGYNGSENFREGARFGLFPSVALGYRISNEKFFEPLSHVITNLKMRGSWGIVGNSFTDPRFPYLTFVNLQGKGYTFGNNWQTSAQGATITKYGAEGARWEKGVKMNAGVDLSLFNSLNISVDIFREKRSDIFMQRRIIPAETGVVGDLRPYANLGKVKNEGLDLSIDFNKQINKDLLISVRGNVTYAVNSLIDRDEPLYGENERYRSELNKPLNCYTGLVAIGLFKDEDDIKNSPEQMFSGYQPGDIKYKDLNGDNKIDGNDMQIIGNPTVPQLVYGLGGSLQYKNFDFSIFFQGVARTSLMMQNIHPFNSDQTSLFKFIADDYWTEENPNAAYPRLISNVNIHNNFQNSTYWLRDGSFLRLKSAEIGYTYKFLRAFVTGENLLTFSSFKHWDAELGGGNGLKYPNLRVGTIGIQMTF